MGDRSEDISMQGAICPVPLQHNAQVVLGHGSGGKMTQDLIERSFYPPFKNPTLLRGNDSAVVTTPEGGRLALTTDSHIVTPLFFPGGDIGRLAICGAVNDLAMVGAKPLWLTAAFILEEGLSLEVLERVIDSMREAAEEAGVIIVAGDTKVAERGKADGLFINTAGVGWVPEERDVGGAKAKPGDGVLLSGSIGDHGIAVLAARGELEFEAQVESDLAPLNELVEAMFEVCPEIHVLRDPTRGGLATTLNEIAKQSGVGIRLVESQIPVNEAVDAACEMLGFDPLYVANEGKLIAMVPNEAVDEVLKVMRKHTYGKQAKRIGEVVSEPTRRVLMQTAIGGTRVVETLSGEMLPRIC
ncbi:MAG: hydrogenase expression/formation protein HypE [Anaerolineales bacterium]|jgi:hydrogenase expression/formation protein HypE